MKATEIERASKEGHCRKVMEAEDVCNWTARMGKWEEMREAEKIHALLKDRAKRKTVVTG